MHWFFPISLSFTAPLSEQGISRIGCLLFLFQLVSIQNKFQLNRTSICCISISLGYRLHLLISILLFQQHFSITLDM
uniref:Uncharacterized protein n=1 Tax=Octopus bimaculoides TaxID=37653 RepID=A0A0L8HHA3_OCTBM